MRWMGAALGLLCAVMTVPARADDASKKAKVEELLTIMRVSRVTEQITGAVRKQLEGSMRGLPGASRMTPEQRKLTDDYEAKVMEVVNQTVNWKALEPQMVDLYVSTYSEPEVDGILAFYKSPVGQTMLSKGPELTQKSMEITQGKLAAMQPKINEMSEEFARQYSAAQTPPAAKPAPAPAASPK